MFGSSTGGGGFGGFGQTNNQNTPGGFGATTNTGGGFGSKYNALFLLRFLP